MSIIASMGTGTERICTSPYTSPYPIEKVGNSPYLVNAGISIKMGMGSGNTYETDLFVIPKGNLMSYSSLSHLN